MAVLHKVRSALCAASQLPREGPTDVEDASAPACLSKPDDDDSFPKSAHIVLLSLKFVVVGYAQR